MRGRYKKFYLATGLKGLEMLWGSTSAFGIAFFRALRINELAVVSTQKPGGLQQNDVSFRNGSIQIRIRRSKTDYLGNGLLFPLFSIAGWVCPIHLVTQYLAIRPDRFYWFWGFLLVSSGLTHFELRAATEAARAGFRDDEIMMIGRWCSSCFFRYIRPDLLMH
ncbi:unnamed protein product [Ranitomeya imitator]|uniref:Uncharacterized protein n=1 Tax=Ranitomeya imitator TaxID=111125 RepID=A0ABN9MMD3_9NEOB|nr:unnamed protein product [Ranitomeya imitator]